MNGILEMIGRTFNVSRAYIFENRPDGQHCDNTYEWCNEGVAPAKHLLQNYPYVEDGVDYRDNFAENGVFYCTNIKKAPQNLHATLEMQGILALLQCAILDEGRFCGFVGFDDCAIHRLWTREQIDSLSFVSRMLSVFLIKKRAQERLSSLESPGAAKNE